MDNTHNEEDDQQRFDHETGEQAHYWFTVSAFAELEQEHGIEKMLNDVMYLQKSKDKEELSFAFSKDDLVRVANDLGIPLRGHIDHPGTVAANLWSLATKVAVKERYACSVVAEEYVQGMSEEYRILGYDIADSIIEDLKKGRAK
jgi:hypothetical protein